MARSLRAAGPCAVAIILFLLPSIAAAQAAPVRSDPTGFHLAGFLNGSALQSTSSRAVAWLAAAA